MSLFKARDWWSTSVGEEEEFDQGCLCVANVDNSSDELDKIVIGSYHGIVRIFNPKPTKTDEGWSGFRPGDVLLESPLGHPVLQIEAGKFVSGSDKLHLAILHPRKLSVYNVAAMSGAVEHGTQYQMALAYEHKLQRTAYNFCFGHFGQVKGKGFICVQSMDGTVSIFEQESFPLHPVPSGSPVARPDSVAAQTGQLRDRVIVMATGVLQVPSIGSSH
ncbi:protein PTHB1-like [Dreissena polymorpha]|uniref:protein PTHB1-like n=1 Tax=Dreissena polymorpha TaxID=45954 RepID=UPI002264186C|nr:protein PTHB1-like [Dreissena polymorpha]